MFSKQTLAPDLAQRTGVQGALFQHSPIAIVVADPRSQLVLRSNSAASQLYGYSEEELAGLPLHRLCDASFAGKSRKHIRKDGAEILVDAIAQIVASQDGDAEFLFITDKSEALRTEQRLWRELDQAQAALRVKTELLSMFSHEFRTPLAGVNGMAAMLADTNLNDQQRDFLDTIRSSGDVLLTVLNDVADLTKIEEQTLSLEAADFNLRSTIEDVFDRATVLASQKKLELSHLLSSNVPLNLRGDAGRLQQILLTLLANVVRIMEAGSVRLSVSVDSGHCGPSTAMPVRLRFELAESGSSISAECAKLLLTGFPQADPLISGHLDRSAVGLAICKRLARLMEGEIGLSGEPGPGAIFWFNCGFSLPADAHAAENVQSLAGQQVLLVQRSSEERTGTRALLESLGMIVTEAANAPQALALCSARSTTQQALPLALVDWSLPVIDGIRFARLLRNQSHNQGTLVVLLAVSSAAHQLQEARDAGAVDVLLKPLRRRQLARCLSQVIFPAAAAPQPAAVPVATPPASASKETASILVVEDNLVNQMVASLCLRKLGYAVEVAEDGLAAVDAFASKRFDLILMDCHMPRMDGATATRKIREMGGYGLKIPILALTADVFQTERDRCAAAGMNDFLSKPIRADLLKSKLEFWLDKSQ